MAPKLLGIVEEKSRDHSPDWVRIKDSGALQEGDHCDWGAEKAAGEVLKPLRAAYR